MVSLKTPEWFKEGTEIGQQRLSDGGKAAQCDSDAVFRLLFFKVWFQEN